MVIRVKNINICLISSTYFLTRETKIKLILKVSNTILLTVVLVLHVQNYEVGDSKMK